MSQRTRSLLGKYLLVSPLLPCMSIMYQTAELFIPIKTRTKTQNLYQCSFPLNSLLASHVDDVSTYLIHALTLCNCALYITVDLSGKRSPNAPNCVTAGAGST